MVREKKRRDAIDFARKAHKDQTYSDVYSYVRHLEAVHEILIEVGFGDDEPLMLSAWLHDTIEDTETSYQDILNIFGELIAEVVYGVTDELGRNRKERKRKTYPKIRENNRSLIIKLADRLANVKFSGSGVFGNSSKLGMYKKEQPEFEKELRGRYFHAPDGNTAVKIEQMWERLTDLLA